jgi:hypothetical protein
VLFDDTVLTVVTDRHAELPDGGALQVGQIAGVPGGAFTVVARGGCIAGAIHAGAYGQFAVDGNSQGVLIRQLNAEDLVTCAVGQDAPRESGADGSTPRAADLRSLSAASDCDDGSVIDFMVVYTAAARAAAGGPTQIQNSIDLAVADANAAFARSQIQTSIRLVHAEEVAYTESGVWQTDAPRLVGTNDGFMDNVHALRDEYGADCVSLWVNTLDTGGIGFFPDGSGAGIGNSGFSMLRLNNAPLLTMAHELGHNLYCTHDRPNTSDVPFAEYSYGYVEPGGAWQTIMAVSPTALIPYFANPSLTWPGPNPPHPGPMGVPVGQPNPCDIVLTINQTRHIVANFRPTRIFGLPPVLHVRADAAPGGSGASWANALVSLPQASCAAAGSGGSVQEVWVKAGTYKPDGGTGDRAATFRPANNLAIYGGFAGSEVSRAQRNPAVNVTILSGDIGIPGNATDNSYHVVTASLKDSSALLDGFTITGGRATGSEPDDRGAGILVAGGGAPTFANCIITGNVTARMGGGVYSSYGSTPTFTTCTISNNAVTGSAWPEGGGGLYSEAGSSPVLTGCTILQNSATLGAGIASFFDCEPVFTDCLLQGNVATGDSAGGAIYNYGGCSPTLLRCTLAGNSAVYGGGMASFFDSLPALTDCLLQGNTAPGNGAGGALYNYGGCNMTLVRCTVADNSAAYGGGMASFFDSLPVVTNCMLRANTATNDGGALYNYDNSSAALTNCVLTGNSAAFGGAINNLFSSNAAIVNCTVVGNTASGAGAGVYNYQSNPVLTNTLLWSNRVGATTNEGAQVYSFDSVPSVSYSSVQGWTGALGGVNNNGSDPLFRDADGADNIFGNADDNARPRSGSPAINAGNVGAVPPGVTTDLDGRPRIIGAAVDRGAYEYTTPAPGDFDGDGDVDLSDYTPFAACLKGPGQAPAPAPPITVQECRAAFDLDADNDVDLADFRRFAGALTN